MLSALLAGLFGLVGPAPAGAQPAGAQSLVTAPVVQRAALPWVNLSDLPSQAADTVDLVQQGGPFPYPQDGTVFQNREGLLPSEPSGYYHEYTVKTPGSPDRGARRIVTGGGSLTAPDHWYYTADHYESFSQVDINS